MCRLRRIFTLFLSLVLMLSLAACGSSEQPSGQPAEQPAQQPAQQPAEQPADSFKATMVTDMTGLGDQGFNDSAHSGLKRADSELGIDTQVIESSEAAQYVPNLMGAAADSEIVVGIGFFLADPTTEAAASAPQAKFAVIDAVAEGENVASILFKEHESAFLAGIAAGLMTKTNKVGFVGGMAIPPVLRFQAGFEAGLKTVNPSARVLVSFVESFGDAPKAKQLTVAQLDAGADIIFEVGGGSGLGSIEAVKERGAGYWVITSDMDKRFLAPDNTLAGALKRVDVGVFNAIKMVRDGTFKGGIYELGIAEGAGGVTEYTFEIVGEPGAAKIRKAQELIAGGRLQIPNDVEAVKSFTPPQL